MRAEQINGVYWCDAVKRVQTLGQGVSLTTQSRRQILQPESHPKEHINTASCGQAIEEPWSYPTTMLTNFLGTTMTFLMVLPSMNGFTFSQARAAFSISDWVASALIIMRSR